MLQTVWLPPYVTSSRGAVLNPLPESHMEVGSRFCPTTQIGSNEVFADGCRNRFKLFRCELKFGLTKVDVAY